MEHLPLRIIIDLPPFGAGQSIIDQEEYDHKSVKVIRDLNREKFFDKIVKYLSNL